MNSKKMRFIVTQRATACYPTGNLWKIRFFTFLCLAAMIAGLGANLAAQELHGGDANQKTRIRYAAPIEEQAIPPEVKAEEPGILETVYTAVFGEPERPNSLVTINVNSVAVDGVTPSAADNDYTRIKNAIEAAGTGDTIVLNGVFDWTEANAAAAWVLGNDGNSGTDDDYAILAPLNKNGVTVTASALGAAEIKGPGDLAAANLEGVFQFYAGGTNQNWTISNIRFVNFDNPIGFYHAGGPITAYSGTRIINNYILLPTDLNAAVAPADASQNIGIHFAFGTNQEISGNTIEIPGDGVSDTSVPSNLRYSSSVGMQSNTSGGAAYNNLQITGNTVRVLNAQTADPQTVLGIWENAHGHTSNITVSNNRFLNAAAGNNPAANLQRGFRVTSHSSASTSVVYANNSVEGANVGFQWLSTSGTNQPVKMTSNNISNNVTGVSLSTNGTADLKYNRIVGNSVSGIDNSTTPGGVVIAEDNWWGCNYGPGATGAGCAGAANGVSGSVTATTWLVLKTTASSTSTTFGGTPVTVTADLTTNSANNPSAGFVPATTVASFSAAPPTPILIGTLSPTSAPLANGLATSTFTAGNTAGPATLSSTVDGQKTDAPAVNVHPIVTSIKRKTPLTQYTSNAPVVFEVIFNAPVKNVDDVDFVVTNLGGAVTGGVSSISSNSPFTNYLVTVGPTTGEGTIRLDLIDDDSIQTRTTNLSLGGPGAGNGNFNTGETYIIDVNAPTVTIKQNPGQADSTTASPIVFDVLFSEPVEGFETGDVSTAGSTAGGTLVAAVSGSGASYTVTVTGMTTSGTVVVNIPGNAAQDLSGKPNTASTTGATINDDNVVNFFAGGAITLMVDDDGQAAPGNCAATTPTFATIQTAVAAAGANYTISVCSGDYTVNANVPLNLSGLSIVKAETAKPIISAAKPSADNNTFTVSAAGVTIDGLSFVKTDNVGTHHIFTVQGLNFTARNNDFKSNFAWTTNNHVSRGFEISGTALNFLLTNNTFTDLRQPAYINGNGGTIAFGTVSNNTATRTKGWVLAEALVNLTGNVFGQTCPTCDADIALIDSNPATPNNPEFVNFFSPYLSLSTNNDNAFVSVQVPLNPSPSGRAVTFVDDVATDGDGRTAAQPRQTIQAAVNNTLPGGLVNVAAGTFNEDVNVARTLTIKGAGAIGPTASIVAGVSGGSGATFQIGANSVDLSGFTITRQGNAVATWNDPGLNLIGVALSGGNTGTIIHDNNFVGNRTGIDVNNTNGHTIRNNIIDNNRTGLILRNQTDDITVVENQINNNWTVGVLFLDGSGGTNSPVQQAKFGTFSNNSISGNWYGQIADRQSGGSITPPGTTNLKNFQGNWLGTVNPVVTTNNTTEPGYAAQIPVIYGGTATAPGGQPDIAGPASANLLYKQFLPNGTDIDAGEFGFQGSPIVTTTSAENDTWYALDETPSPHAGSGSAAFVPGPGGQPRGNGSAKIVVDDTGRWNISTKNYQGLRLNDITSMSYSTYQEAGSPGLIPIFQFDVDDNLNDIDNHYQGRLVFIPQTDVNNNAPTIGTWQKWDLKSPNARFYGSPGSGARPLNVLCPPATNGCTIAEILAAYPNAGVRLTNTDVFSEGRMHFRMGGPWPGGSTAYVDDFQLGVGNTVTIHDFEADRPTVTINQAAMQSDPTNISPINFTVVFSEPVTGFDASDITFGGTSVPAANSAVITQIDAVTYNVAVSGMGGNGTVTATVNENAATGTGGGTRASTSTDNTVTYDTIAPTVTADLSPGQTTPTNNPVISFTIDFNETMTGFDQSDLAATLSNAAINSFTDNGDTTYTVVVTATAPGAVTLSVPAGAATDPAGNVNTASNTAEVVYDPAAPTVTIAKAPGQADPANASPVNFTVTFSEPVVGFTSADVTIATGAGTAFNTNSYPQAVVTGSGPAYNVAVSGMNRDGTVTISIVGNVVVDTSGNPNTGSTPDPANDTVAFVLQNTTVLVSPANMQNWALVSENTPGGIGQLVTGPAAPPAGSGSVQMLLSAGTQGQTIQKIDNTYFGTRFSELTTYSYSSYQNTPSNPQTTISLAFNLDENLLDGNTAFQGRLNYEPTYDTNNSVQQNQWQTWDLLSPTARFWASNNANSTIDTACPQSAPCTRAQILSLYPNLGFHPTQGVVVFKVGSGVATFDGNIDNLVIGKNSVNTTYNFEATPPTVSIGDAVAVAEGNSGVTQATFAVSIDTVSTLPTRVRISTAPGTAAAGDDYVTATNQLVTIPAGQTSVNVTVNVVGETLFETDEQFFVSLSNAENAAIGDGQAVGTITNDDAAPTISVEDASVTEGDAGTSVITFTVTKSGNATVLPATVNYQTTDGTATGGATCAAGVDYITPTGGQIVIPAASASGTFDITVCNDNLVETNETFTVGISSADANASGTDTAVGTIVNDDATVAFAAATYTVSEGGTATITITRSGVTAQTVSVDYAVTGGTASAGDYSVIGSGSVSFLPSETSKTFTVNAVSDAMIEGNETVSFALSNAVNADIGTPSSTVLTISDGAAGGLSISGNITLNGNPLGGVNVTLTGSNPGSLTATTDALGNYSFNGLLGGANYLVTPGSASYVFEPNNRSYLNLAMNVTNANFIAYPTGAIPRNVRIGNATTAVGSTVTVPVILTSLGNERGMTFTIDFDETRLAVATPLSSNVVCGTGAPAGCAVVSNVTSASGNQVLVGSLTAPTPFAAGQRQMLRITFNVVAPANTPSFTTPLTFLNGPTPLRVSDGTNPLPASFTNGTVTVNNLESDVAQPRPGDGLVDVSDVAQVERFAALLDTPNTSNGEFQRADSSPAGVGGDGFIDVSDVFQAERYAALLDPLQPASGPTSLASPFAKPFDLSNMQSKSGERTLGNTDLRIVSRNAAAGDTILVTVAATVTGNENGLQFSINYDPTRLSLPSPNKDNDVIRGTGAFDTNGDSARITRNTLTNGKIFVIIKFDLSNTISTANGNDVQLLQLRFRVAPTVPAGTALPIIFSDDPGMRKIIDSTNTEVSATYTTGNVNVLTPTSAGATVSGRVVDAGGQGVKGTAVSIIAGSGQIRTVVTNSFGNYVFQNVQAGETYIVAVSSKKYRFTPETRTITVNGDAAGIDFTAEN